MPGWRAEAPESDDRSAQVVETLTGSERLGSGMLWFHDVQNQYFVVLALSIPSGELCASQQPANGLTTMNRRSRLMASPGTKLNILLKGILAGFDVKPTTLPKEPS